MKNKLFVLTKFIKAKSVLEAIKKDAKTPVHECWIDDDWKKKLDSELTSLASSVGFEQEEQDDEYEKEVTNRE